MNAIESIVGSYKAAVGLRFDKDAAERLGIKGKAFSNYMNGRSRLPDRAMVQIAQEGHIPLEKVIAATNMVYVNTPDEDRPFWEQTLASVRS
ncbi:hypothetical protein GmRootV118_24790 [Variovorax sp. V118]|uniref:hypothetical protein n=1 Tax=Variovorax sp. V118 TaxID=3065954 RepID=UPI0034E8FBC0